MPYQSFIALVMLSAFAGLCLYTLVHVVKKELARASMQ